MDFFLGGFALQFHIHVYFDSQIFNGFCAFDSSYLLYFVSCKNFRFLLVQPKVILELEGSDLINGLSNLLFLNTDDAIPAQLRCPILDGSSSRNYHDATDSSLKAPVLTRIRP